MVMFKLYGLRKTNQNNKIEDINFVTLFPTIILPCSRSTKWKNKRKVI